MPAADPDRDAPPPPTARACLEQAGDRGGANGAATVAGEPPSGDVIPISADDPVTTPRAVRALARLVMDIPGTCDKKVASDNFYVHGLIGLSRMAELVASLCRNGQRRRRLVKRESVGSNSFCITVLMIVVRLVVLICGTHDNAAQAASFNPLIEDRL